MENLVEWYSYLKFTQLPSSGGICRRSLFWRSNVIRFSIVFNFSGSIDPTWLLLIKIVSSVGMRYRTSGSVLNLLKYEQNTLSLFEWGKNHSFNQMIWSLYHEIKFSLCKLFYIWYKSCIQIFQKIKKMD